MPNKGKGLGQRPLWTITSNQTSQLGVLTADPDEDGGFLPVFSFEEEVEAFLRLLGDVGNADWSSREGGDNGRTDLDAPGALRAGEAGGPRPAAIAAR